MADELPDKDYLYGKFDAGEQRRQRLAHKLAAKSLDIDDEEMNIDASRRGISAAGAIGIGAIAAVPSIIVTAFLLWQSLNAKPVVQQVPSPADSEYQIRFFDEHDNPIDVPRYQPAK